MANATAKIPLSFESVLTAVQTSHNKRIRFFMVLLSINEHKIPVMPENNKRAYGKNPL